MAINDKKLSPEQRPRHGSTRRAKRCARPYLDHAIKQSRRRRRRHTRLAIRLSVFVLLGLSTAQSRIAAAQTTSHTENPASLNEPRFMLPAALLVFGSPHIGGAGLVTAIGHAAERNSPAWRAASYAASSVNLAAGLLLVGHAFIQRSEGAATMFGLSGGAHLAIGGINLWALNAGGAQVHTGGEVPAFREVTIKVRPPAPSYDGDEAQPFGATMQIVF